MGKDRNPYQKIGIVWDIVGIEVSYSYIRPSQTFTLHSTHLSSISPFLYTYLPFVWHSIHKHPSHKYTKLWFLFLFPVRRPNQVRANGQYSLISCLCTFLYLCPEYYQRVSDTMDWVYNGSKFTHSMKPGLELP